MPPKVATFSTNLDLFSDICMEGQLGVPELLDVTGVKQALTFALAHWTHT